MAGFNIENWEDMELSQHHYDPGIPYKKGWTWAKTKLYTKEDRGYWFDNLYLFDDIKFESEEQAKYHSEQQQKNGYSELDETLWSEICGILEEHRQFAESTFQEFGLNQFESHFLAIRVTMSAISKFRLQMFIEFGGQHRKGDFRRTALRNAINILWRRLASMNVDQTYIWSTEAVQPCVGAFKDQLAHEVTRRLMETGAIFFAKITI